MLAPHFGALRYQRTDAGLIYLQKLFFSFTPLNNYHQTRLPYHRNSSSSPDISLASPSVLLNLAWQLVIKLGSDHLPIFNVLPIAEEFSFAPHKTYKNFKKPDWTSFKDEIEGTIAKISISIQLHVNSAEWIFGDTVLSASRHLIPAS